MPRLLMALLTITLAAASSFVSAQTSYRLKGTLKDGKGAVIAGARVPKRCWVSAATSSSVKRNSPSA